MEIGVHAIIQTSRVDSVVDDNPQIAMIEGNACEILNVNDGELDLQNPQISDLKMKINGIAEKQATVFNLMLDGPEEVKRKLDEVLEEYRSNRKT